MTAGDAAGHSAAAAKWSASILRQRIGNVIPDIALVLGSGLSAVTDAIEDQVRVPYRDVPGFAEVRVEGHAGAVVAGTIADRKVLAFAGRFHMYEGHPPQVVAFPIRVAHALGVETLIVSNAAGGISPRLSPGELMIIEDHLNLMFQSPLVGPRQEGDTRFPDMSAPYDPVLIEKLRDAGDALGVQLQRGVYAALLGPAYETRAEVRMLERLGADAVGMSTVPEVIVARAIGMRVAGVSCITNMACGIGGSAPSHDEVLATAAQLVFKLRALVAETVRRL